MTHIDNIPHILQYGITHMSSPNANPQYRAIGDSELIARRSSERRSTISGKIFIPGDFIPFYFYVRMPMLYNIQHGYRVEKVSPEDIVYLIAALNPIVSDPDRELFFSDGHAMSAMSSFYGKDMIDKMDTILDRSAILNDEWGDDYKVKVRKQAEFLVKGDIPMDCVLGLCCYNSRAKERLLEMGASCEIYVYPKAYY